MPVRIGVLSLAHGHCWGYIGACRRHPGVELVGAWDDDPNRRGEFLRGTGLPAHANLEKLLDEVDAVIVTSENRRHAELIAEAAAHGKHVLCEKPLVTSESEADVVLRGVESSGIKLMTAFPCRYSPAFKRLVERIDGGEIGKIVAICATNRGTCPFSWFVEPAKSGGGSMIDHVVHVTDLLRTLLREEPVRVQAQIGNNVYGKEWEDAAMLTIEFGSGIFATLDSSWSRPSCYKTWGDVTMDVVGEAGVLELDMFGQEAQVYRPGSTTHSTANFGASLDDGLIGDFVRCIVDDTEPAITAQDGLAATRVAIAGYRSVELGQPVAV